MVVSTGGPTEAAGPRPDPVVFRILGPLEVVVAGRPTLVGGPRIQAVLAALLMGRDRVVSIEEIGDAVWGETPPASVRNQVLMAVSVLRRGLREAGCHHDVIDTSGPGYRIRVPDVEVDAWRAEDEISAGRAAARAGNRSVAATHLRGALGRWRGPVLSGLRAGLELAAATARLDELRLVAVEELADLELGLGRHRDLAGELAGYLAEAPLREGLRGQLMLALYRSGRRADALDVYATGRVLLADELGIDPGPELRRLHEAILADDPGLAAGSTPDDPPAGTAPDTNTGTPAELPPAVPYFVGRGPDLDQAVAAITATPGAVVAIDGPGGIGKSALAAQVAHQVSDRFPDGQLYVDLHGFTPGGQPLPPVEVLARFLRSLGLRDPDIPARVDEAANRFRTLVNQRRVLVVLDNALDAAQVRPLLPSSPHGAVIVTSRHVLGTLDSATRLHLTALDDDASAALLANAVGADRVAAEPDAAQRIAYECGGLPLALRISSAHLVADPGRSLASIAASLDVAWRRLDALEHADLAVRASFETSFTRLRDNPDGTDAASLFPLLGHLDTPSATTATTRALTGWADERADAAAEALLSARLIERDGPGRFRLHDLLRLFARELAASPEVVPDRVAPLRRVADHFLATVLRVRSLLNLNLGRSDGDRPLADPGVELASAGDAVAWLDAEFDNLIAGIARFVAYPELYETALRIGRAMVQPCLGRGRVGELATVQERLYAAAVSAGDDAGQGESLNYLGTVAMARDDHEAAEKYITESLAVRRRLSDPVAAAGTLVNLAILYAQTGRLDRAPAIYLDLVGLFHDLGDSAREALALNNLAQAYRDLGRLDESVAAGLRGLALRREIGAHHEIGMNLLTLAQTYLDMNDPRLAIKHFDEAVEVLRDCGDSRGVASGQWDLGRAHRALGDPDRARAYWRESVRTLEGLELMDPDEARDILASDSPPVPTALRDR